MLSHSAVVCLVLTHLAPWHNSFNLFCFDFKVGNLVHSLADCLLCQKTNKYFSFQPVVPTCHMHIALGLGTSEGVTEVRMVFATLFYDFGQIGCLTAALGFNIDAGFVVVCLRTFSSFDLERCWMASLMPRSTSSTE